MRIILNAAFNVFAHVGITKYLQHITGALRDRCDLTVLTPDPGVFPADVQTTRIPVWTARDYGRMFWTISGIRRHTAYRPNTVLLCPTPDTPPWPRLPVISIVHDLTPLVLSRYHGAREKLFFSASICSLRWASTILTVSENTAGDLIKRFPRLARRVSVCYNGPGIMPKEEGSRVASSDSTWRTNPWFQGSSEEEGSRGQGVKGFGSGPRTLSFGQLDLGTLDPFPLRFRPYLIYVGGYSRHKNLARLLAAFARIRTRPDLKLLLLGGERHPNMTALQLTVRELGITGRVVFLDSLPDESVSELYRSAELLVYPSLYEGFGLPVLEALLHGTPVVCSRAASIPEVAGSLAVYFDPTSTDEMAAAIVRALSHRDSLVRRVRSAQGTLAHFSWDRAADRIMLVAERLADSPKPHEPVGRG